MQDGADSWQVWIDRGGTFTDVVARRPDGHVVTAKLLSEDPARTEDAAIAAIRQLTGAKDGPLPPVDVRMGTTVATNALLERKGEPTVLAITRGFGDALRIGTQERPELFVRRIDLPQPPHARVIEIAERVMADGTVLTPLDEATARTAFAEAVAAGFRSIAIVLMHGYRYPAHEARLAELARAAGFTQVSVSHEVAPLIKLIGRGDTTLVDAYLSPVLRRYVDQFTAALGGAGRALFMQSSGGLAGGARFRGKDAILSGPAGGIIGMARTAEASGAPRVIGFDMGGTSTDVSHYAGQFERDSEVRVANVRIRTPMLRIHTVAAGGGSICRFDAGRLVVGPESAGAVPGPACYRNGGPLTVTDCNVILGKLRPDHFPHLFGPNGDQPIDTAVVARKLAEMAAAIRAETGQIFTPEALAEGFIAIAVANMAHAIKQISVARGHDVTGYALSCFGGAGGQHACLVADELAIDTVLVHPLAGVLSAYGMGLASEAAVRERTLAVPLVDGTGAAHALADELGELVHAELGSAAAEVHTSLFLRREGSENTIELPLGAPDQLASAFAAAHRAQFGYDGDGALVIDRVRVEAIASGEASGALAWPLPEAAGPPLETVECHLAGAAHRVPVYDRAALPVGFAAQGPLIVIDPLATTVVEPGWALAVDPDGTLRLTRSAPRAATVASGTEADPVRLEIFNGLFMAIAEEMGSALARTAMSVNIRERLDFSCAIFDATGRLVANAPHMPVHLGSMGESVQAILRERACGKDGRGIRRGDAYVLNAPYAGGTHLPDITVVMPVFVRAGAEPDFYVAARGHHADVGGIAPGSMPPTSRSIDEEGVLLENVLLVDEGRFLEAEIAAILSSGPYPARNIAANVADLKAQVAACARGAAGLERACAEHGSDVVRAYMGHVHANAEEAVRRLIGRLEDGAFRYELDNGAVVGVAVRVDRVGRQVTIDFAGTSDQLPGNFNAPFSVVRAAVMYVLRTMIDDPIPMNEGCLVPVTILVPEGCMLRPRYPAAVVAGNVETSQVVTDALFGAFGAMAAAQGTMNNLTFGNERYQYYETIAGGSGAGPDFDGTSVVQTHMTNSRLTDPEVLETRFPVLLEEFSIRRGSGGAGRHRGGDGALRRLRFLEAMEAGMLANRRRIPPFGLAGGAPGEVGATRVERTSGEVEVLESTAGTVMQPGDVMVVETPGGGGFGQ
ncbi:hydantoinase B/oxoprolinase family protein [Novosphingobium sp.]|jgi:5-oxoprolinase (ATP-hydrolysing)|uniref:hydantoinase B/oxoprolinase family protein n=1 Tax=Novosphingobium sp. TaxID=1874826 RepID=UPI0022BB5B4F|nr:hydantoinase B/oxoprolinase family protein [Novosphingobium sp.]MCZ8019956.1 hydantoinase B/oxoprolinase family protein [Novosphingobium sp.]MCZ8035601.1 hydantoinase B/oxoprolinase family protein [Novosphingobium sp.]MCZ8052999.1 hydantoinase B/oxoprolinase family protein [Novosphingobium sp.]MCZ8060996.1 hydantoinase B/oxoprolinase family protein [Novosphingobium sp.]MCZ8230725.1 hydantoinase B/oxoprolinase family protein [Novosphingobium sp.]